MKSLAFILSTLPILTDAYPSGSWHWDSPQTENDLPEISLSINFSIKNRNVTGQACVVYSYGNRIDCPLNECNITGTYDENDHSASIIIHSEYYDEDYAGKIDLSDGLVHLGTLGFVANMPSQGVLMRKTSSKNTYNCESK